MLSPILLYGKITKKFKFKENHIILKVLYHSINDQFMGIHCTENSTPTCKHTPNSQFLSTNTQLFKGVTVVSHLLLFPSPLFLHYQQVGAVPFCCQVIQCHYNWEQLQANINSIYGRNQSGCEKAKNAGFLPFILWIFMTVYIFVALMKITICCKQLEAIHIMSWDS